jgi:hypothetical protein
LKTKNLININKNNNKNDNHSGKKLPGCSQQPVLPSLAVHPRR